MKSFAVAFVLAALSWLIAFGPIDAAGGSRIE